jgi:hypothetical protein
MVIPRLETANLLCEPAWLLWRLGRRQNSETELE